MTNSLTREALIAHATDWITAWNTGDLESVLAPWHEDGIFVSPVAALITGAGEIRGKSRLRAYWRAALARAAGLHFTLLSAHADAGTQSLLVHYVSATSGRRVRAAELMVFSDGRQIGGEAFYGAEVTPAPELPA
ncbi:conserved hypothetical protein TIGR02246 [Hyphomonas neptunium ATCC 15444]|uniref:SnoaL-like domain-containing protein n=2 Tax=Hyphomonas TaxID=85 RepID=Q0C267_HYPNA|nr:MULTISPECIES: nuclear transport factor 2 family protein [Hyphomonas]ABI78090.1 conserved hypothetical protein TIGR02246 [Hyphomonas neptunium ATCC 15444]KCZ93112.1 hypothetical protein HHI_10524 [Hyphomonas hirschiana VP5]